MTFTTFTSQAPSALPDGRSQMERLQSTQAVARDGAALAPVACRAGVFPYIAAAASSARRTARHRCQSACAMYSGGWQGARQPHANGRPPDRAASRTWAVYFSASTVYCRMILMALLRSGSRSLKACELRYATAWSRLSNSVIPTCLGGSPTNATTFP
jgi:hypothetical protein